MPQAFSFLLATNISAIPGGIAVGSAATLFAISACGIPEAVAAHPPRNVVLFNGRIGRPRRCRAARPGANHLMRKGLRKCRPPPRAALKG